MRSKADLFRVFSLTKTTSAHGLMATWSQRTRREKTDGGCVGTGNQLSVILHGMNHHEVPASEICGCLGSSFPTLPPPFVRRHL